MAKKSEVVRCWCFSDPAVWGIERDLAAVVYSSARELFYDTPPLDDALFFPFVILFFPSLFSFFYFVVLDVTCSYSCCRSQGLWTSPRGEAYDGHLVRGKKSGEVSWATETAVEPSQTGYKLSRLFHGLLYTPMVFGPPGGIVPMLSVICSLAVTVYETR